MRLNLSQGPGRPIAAGAAAGGGALNTQMRGALEMLPDGSLDGWCWSPRRAGERLTVEILDGDLVVLTVIAQRFRRDLAQAGIGDGRHAFQVRLPEHPDAAGDRLIRARERVSGVVFGTVRDAAGGHGRTGIERLDRATAELAALQAGIDRLRARAAAQREHGRPARALHDMAVMLETRSRLRPSVDDAAFAVAAARADLRRRFAPFAVPAGGAAPAVSLIVLAAADIADTVACLRTLAALPSAGGTEIVLADDGRDPRTILLPALVGGLRVAGAPARETGAAARAGQAMGQAAALSRGGHLVMLAAQAWPPSLAALALLLRALADHPDHVVTGGAGRDSLARWGLAAPHAAGRQEREAAALVVRLSGRIGLVAALPRARWTEIGGFDPELADGAGLDCADLTLKAWLLGCRIGHAVERHAGGAAAAMDGPAASPEGAWQAATVFRARWGGLGLEQEAAP